MKPIVVISPYNVASFPEGAGHFWVYLQYALGLYRIGCEVYWLERFRTGGHGDLKAQALATFRARMKAYGMEGRVLLYRARSSRSSAGAPEEYLGVPREEAESIFERADLLVNFHYSISPALLKKFRRTALVDLDPGLVQLWIRSGQLRVPAHDAYFTIAEGVERAHDGGLRWHPIHPAVSLEHWTMTFDPGSEAFTTISIWDSSDWVIDGSERYENSKRVAFLETADLPRMIDQPLELALYLRTGRDMEERTDLESRGWRVRDSRDVASTPETYRSYIQRSRGEFSVAKPSYVKLKTAWVSDRTACYLASGKPVVVQDTGPSAYLPNGEGMFRFSSPGQAAAALAEINADYERHCSAARRLAEEHFDARRVVKEILEHSLS